MAGPGSRKPALVTGSVLALLAGVAGIIGIALSNSPAVPVGVVFSEQCAYAVPVAVAIAALTTRGRQTFMLVLLLGMWWSSAAWISWDAAAGSAGQFFTGADRVVNGNVIWAISDVLGLAAMIVLLAAWRPTWERGAGARAHALAVLVLLAVASVQIAQAVLFTTAYRTVAYNVDGAALFLTGAAVAWYATGVHGRRYGGALLLGWAARKALSLIADMVAGPLPAGRSTLSGILACAAVAVTLALAVVYLHSRPAVGR